jgi:hypothetical protein
MHLVGVSSMCSSHLVDSGRALPGMLFRGDRQLHVCLPRIALSDVREFYKNAKFAEVLANPPQLLVDQLDEKMVRSSRI